MSLLLLMGGSAPNVASLFANNEAGLALDVETAYLRGWVFQDSAGQTVAAAAGDPVGLILDTAKGGLDQLGSDLVSNGTFASDTVWTKGANWTIGSGVATKTGGAANNLTQTITSTAGLWYRITIDVTRTAGTLTVSLGTSGTTRAISADGSYTFFILAGSSTQTLTLAGDSSFAGTVNNVTARLVPGNHAYQTTSGSRPSLSIATDSSGRTIYGLTFDGSDDFLQTASINFPASTIGTRRNLLDSSENWGSPWTGTVASATFNQPGPEGLNNATTFTTALTGGQTHVQTVANYTPSQQYVVTFWVKAGTATTANFGMYANGSFLSQTGSVLSGSGAITGTTLQTISGLSALSWTKFQVVFTAPASGQLDLYFYGETSGVKTGLSQSIAQFQVELGSTPTAYQPTGTDKMTVMAGVRKLSDAASGMIIEIGISSAAGSFSFLAPNSVSPNGDYYFRSRGTGSSNATSAKSAPSTDVLSGIGDISGDISSLRINGSVAATSTADQGTGNYTNNALYIGSRGGSSLRFNGILYTLIVRGATTPTGTIADFEKNLLARRCGVTF